MRTAIVVEQMNATDAKNRFGEVLAAAVKYKAVSLMKHGKPAAYVISPEMYELVVAAMQPAPSPLDRLERDFEEMIAAMQEPRNIRVAKSLMTIDTAKLRDELLRHAKSQARKATRRAA